MADDGTADRLNAKQWKDKFLCADVDDNDCLDSGEFVNMLSVGFTEAGESTIDAIAFAADLQTLTDNGYDALDQTCARIFLKLDGNEDKVLQAREAKKWIRDYADPDTVGDTVGLQDKYFRKTVRGLVMGNRYVKGEPVYFRWSEFLPACKNTAVIPLKADHEITVADLAHLVPPALYVPDDDSKPPYEIE